jgi:hypothetical protein
MDQSLQQTLPAQRLPAIILNFTVEPGEVLSWRLAVDSELRVRHERVWLTRVGSNYDYWLHPGETIRLQRRELIRLSTDANAAAEVSLIGAYVARSGFGTLCLRTPALACRDICLWRTLQ